MTIADRNTGTQSLHLPVREGALKGVRIIDFTHWRVGPVAARMSAFFGAEVIKVERVDEYEGSRMPTMGRGVRAKEGPPPKESPNASGNFSNMNADKLGVTLNTRHPEGFKLIEELIRKSDAVIENFSASVLESWGLSFEHMKELNPKIAYVSMSGFGHAGSLKSFRSYGPTAQAISGLTFTSGLPGKESAGWGFSYMDVQGGFIGGLALLTAIYQTRRTGKACYIDDAIVEGAMMMLGPFFLDYAVNGRRTRRPDFPPGNRSLFPPLAPHNTYRCAAVDRVGQDLWCFIACETQEQFQALCQVIGRSDVASDPRFATMEARVENQDALDAIIGEWTMSRSRYDVMDALQAVGVIAAPVQNAEDRVEWDPQFRHRGIYPVVDNPELGPYKYESHPAKLKRSSARTNRGSPLWGEHNDYVYGEILGLPQSEIDRLRIEGVIS